MKLRVAVAGATGYVGGELIRLIAGHPNLELVTVTANSSSGQRLRSFHKDLGSYADLVCVETNKENLEDHDVIFLALPHTKSAEVATYLPEKALVLDCGADFRLESSEKFEEFYHSPHAGTWVYGMPELLIGHNEKQRTKLKSAKRIAVPGCNATAIILAYAPLLASNLIEPKDLVATLAVGTSGAGKNAEVNLGEGLKSAQSYQVGGVHRHIPEVQQNLNRVSEEEISITFTPVLVPMFRGILAVNTALMKDGANLHSVRLALEKAYEGEDFVKVLPEGEFPDTKDVESENLALIGVAIDKETNRVVVISAIDNLVKGTAGAAIQSMNIALGLKEDLGITNAKG